MQKIIEQLYDGGIFPNEQLKVRIDDYKEARAIAFEAYEVFEEKLCQVLSGILQAPNFYPLKQIKRRY